MSEFDFPDEVNPKSTIDQLKREARERLKKGPPGVKLDPELTRIIKNFEKDPAEELKKLFHGEMLSLFEYLTLTLALKGIKK